MSSPAVPTLDPIFAEALRPFAPASSEIHNRRAAAEPTPSRNPFEIARSKLIRRLLDLQVPADFSVRRPRRGEFDEVAAFIRDLANAADECLYAIGEEVADNAARAVDMSAFSGAFLGAVDGNATYVTQTAPFASDEEAA